MTWCQESLGVCAVSMLASCFFFKYHPNYLVDDPEIILIKGSGEKLDT